MASDQTSVVEKKSGFNLGQFVGETRREIGKVAWPSRKETVQMTIMIVVMALITGLFFFIVDWLLGKAISTILSMNM